MGWLPLAVFGAALWMVGCVPPPQRVDPFAGLSSVEAVDSPYKELSVGIVLSDNAKNAVDYLHKHQYSSMIDSDAMFDGYVQVFQRDFKTAVRLGRMEEAHSSRLDVFALLDIYYELPKSIFHPAKCDVNVTFMTQDQQRIDLVHAESARNPRENPGIDGSIRVVKALHKASEECHSGFEKALLRSEKLISFAQSKGGAAPLAQWRPDASPASPPREKILHSDVDQPSYRAAEGDDRFALLIGIDKYENLPQAEFAERDAQAVRAHLRALGYPERNIIFLTGSKAGKAGIEKYVESWLPRNIKKDSRLFVYFSGHGAPDVNTGQAYLVPWDGDAKFLENTGYPLKRLYEKLNALKARQVIVAMDACFSGAGGRSVLAKGARPLVTKVDTGASALGNVIVLAASGGDEITGTEENQGHGLFTYYMLKGLNDRRGDATAKQLFDYLLPQVQDAARRDNRDQTPQLLSASAAAAKLSLK